MRELKFRAWEKRDLFMHYSDDSKTFYGLHDFFKSCADLSETFMQYTGLKDKNSKDIYEGDIVKDDDGYIHEIKFGKLPLGKAGDCVCTYLSFYAKSYGKLGQAPYYKCEEIGEWMEIIGNVFEHPELLEVSHAL